MERWPRTRRRRLRTPGRSRPRSPRDMPEAADRDITYRTEDYLELAPAHVGARGRDVAEHEQAWRVIRLHNVAFAHSGSEAPRMFSELLGLPCAHEEAAAGFTERRLPAGDGYGQFLGATGPGIGQRCFGRRGPGRHHGAFEGSDRGESGV